MAASSSLTDGPKASPLPCGPQLEERERIPDPTCIISSGGHIVAVNGAAARLATIPLAGPTVRELVERYGAERADGGRLIIGDPPTPGAPRRGGRPRRTAADDPSGRVRLSRAGDLDPDRGRWGRWWPRSRSGATSARTSRGWPGARHHRVRTALLTAATAWPEPEAQMGRPDAPREQKGTMARTFGDGLKSQRTAALSIRTLPFVTPCAPP